jgi:hypothetical protein
MEFRPVADPACAPDHAERINLTVGKIVEVQKMKSETLTEGKKTCFVVMGFGKKTDFETGRALDLDRTYRNIIKPAVTAAGLECIRADEIKHSGPIEVPMYEQLLNAMRSSPTPPSSSAKTGSRPSPST